MVTPRRLVAAGLAAAVALAVVLGMRAAEGGGGAPGLPNGEPLAATGTIQPTVVLFGDPITARLDIAVDRRKLDPDGVRVATDFRPFDRLAAHRTRRDTGRIAYIRETYTLRCLALPCVPLLARVAASAEGTRAPQRRATVLEPARVFAQGPAGVRPLTIRWPTVETVTRLNQSELELSTFYYHSTVTPPDPYYAVSPGTLLGLLTLALVAAIAVPAMLVLRRLVARRRAKRPEPRQELPPLEQALRLLEWANRQADGEDRRRALELVAVELLRGGRSDLGARARELAWSQAPPRAQEAERLEAHVRSTVGGNGATPA
jgi:hypothetical protein